MIDIHLDRCESTQDEVRERLTSVGPGTVVAVSADSQRGGRGREGRTWEDPPGDALMLSVGRQGPLPTSVLADLPRRVAHAVLDALGPEARGVVTWKAPNDLVAVVEGAKVAGVLVDARTVGEDVEHVVVGIGLNLAGNAFTTGDGRNATSLAAIGHATDAHTMRTRLIDLVAAQLS